MRGSRRYKCRACARVYTPDPLPLGYSEEMKREAVRLYLEGTNFRRIGRVLGVNHQSVINWVNSYHATLPASGQALASPEMVALDELFTFVGSKNASLRRHGGRSSHPVYRLLRRGVGAHARGLSRSLTAP